MQTRIWAKASKCPRPWESTTAPLRETPPSCRKPVTSRVHVSNGDCMHTGGVGRRPATHTYRITFIHIMQPSPPAGSCHDRQCNASRNGCNPFIPHCCPGREPAQYAGCSISRSYNPALSMSKESKGERATGSLSMPHKAKGVVRIQVKAGT